MDYEHKPLVCPNCKSKNVVKIVLRSDFFLPLLTTKKKVSNALKTQFGVKIESRNEAEELIRNHEAVIYDADDFKNIPSWKCIDCNAYFLKNENPPVRYKFKAKPFECPVCGSKRIADIQYGDPAFSEELRVAEIKGETIIGGCCIEDDSPAWRCYECEQNLHAE
ncbi:MAG: hypothetical protein WC071_12785 [Victivallaceae bacterium]